MLLSSSKPKSALRVADRQQHISSSLRRGVVQLTPKGAESRYKVLIVDRDPMSSDLLANALVHERRCDATTIQPSELMPALTTDSIDLVVIGAEAQSDLGDGFDLANLLDRSHPHVSIVMLLNVSSQESVIKAFRSGARGVFSRLQSMPEFFDCIEHVRKGYIWAGRQETNSLMDAFRSIPAFSLVSVREAQSLTARELQVVQSAAKGKTNRAIASELSLSEHTVKNYLFRAFEKLGVSSRVELLFYLALQNQRPPVATGQNTAMNRDADLGRRAEGDRQVG